MGSNKHEILPRSIAIDGKHILLLAQEIGDPRWNHFVSELSKQTGVPESVIFQIVEALAKDTHRKKNTRHSCQIAPLEIVFGIFL